MQYKIRMKNLRICTVARRIVPLLAVSLFYTTAFGQSNGATHEVTTAVPLLRVSPDTRAAAMGESSLATSPDAASGMVNVAKAAFTTRQTGVTLNYAPWLRDVASDIYLLSLAGYRQIDDKQVVTGSLRYFNSGRIEERDYNNTLVQLITPTEVAVDLGYARKLSEVVSLGVAFRYINSSIGNTVANVSGTAHAFAADLSAYYNGTQLTGRGLTAGLAIANIGTAKVRYGDASKNGGFLPAKIGLGAAYHIPLQNDDVVSITGEVGKSLVPLMLEGDEGLEKLMEYNVLESYGKGLANEAVNFSAGAEYKYADLLAIRAGYFIESKAYGGRSYVSAGAGLYYGQAGLDLAYIVPSGSGISRNALSNTLRLGLTFFFDSK